MALVDEHRGQFVRESGGQRIRLALDGEESTAARFADELAAVLVDQGQPAVRVSLGDDDEPTLRSATVEPFRAGTLPGASDRDTVVVVDGRRLLNLSVRGIWHFSVWVLAGDELPHAAVNVIVDATDESAPKRYFYDLCKLPPSVGERR